MSVSRAPAPLSATKESPLVKGRRMAWAENTENSGQGSPRKPSSNRFGFNPRSKSTTRDTACSADSIDVISKIEARFDSFDTAEDALKAKRPGKYESGRNTKLEDQNKRLKHELSGLMERAKGLPRDLAPLQASINDRMQSGAELQAQLRIDNDQLRSDLRSAQTTTTTGPSPG